MAEAPTPVFKFIKPDIGGSQETWGNRLNKDLDDIDAILFGLNNASYTALQNGLNTQTLKQYDSSGNVIAGSSLPATDVKFRTATQPLGYAKAVTDDLPTFFPNDKPGYIPPVRWVNRMIDLLLPVGSIITWFGQTTNIPAGWHLCDGAGNTPLLIEGTSSEFITIPDLRGRFILGAFADTATSNVQLRAGGSNADPADFSHDHNATDAGWALTKNQIPPHFHEAKRTDSMTMNGNFFGRTLASGGVYPGNWHAEAESHGVMAECQTDAGTLLGAAGNGTGTAAAKHFHTIDVLANNTPGVPWWTLCYIIKIRKWETFV